MVKYEEAGDTDWQRHVKSKEKGISGFWNIVLNLMLET